MSRFTAFIDRLIESGWLIALVIVPLFFNVYSYRVFEPDKLGLLRTIVTVMAALALVLLLEKRFRIRQRTGLREWLGSWVRTPLIAPALAITLVYILTTAWSVTPRISFMGSYQRLQGTYSLLCYVILFGCMVAYLRERAQVERVLTVIVLTSLPVALYGLLQHHGLDPLPWQGDVTARVASTMGNAIFVGAYLIMAIPLTAGRWLLALRQVGAGGPGQHQVVAAAHVGLLLVQTVGWAMLSFSQATLLMLLLMALSLLTAKLRHRDLASETVALVSGQVLAVQLVALLFCGSRGPQIGLLVGIVLFALLSAAVARRRRLAVGIVAAGLSLLAVLITLNLPRSPLAGVRNVPYVGQLGRLLEMDAGTGKVRTLIWEGAVALLRDDPLRAITGYGPETMYVVYNRYYPAELAHYESRTASPDRSHNETFDALITTGALGLLASLYLFVALFLHGFTALGLTASRLSRRAFVGCAAAGGILGAVIPALLDDSLRLSGVGLPIGMVLGILLFVASRAVQGGAAPASLEVWQKAIVIALLASIAAHWAEISVGIAIASTRTYFWAYAALLVAVIRWKSPAPPTPLTLPAAGAIARTRRKSGQRRVTASRQTTSVRLGPAIPFRSRPSTLAAIAMAASLALIPITLIWDLLGNPAGLDSAARVLATAMAGSADQSAHWSYGPFWLGLTVLVSIVATTLASWRQSVESVTGGEWLRMTAIALGIPAFTCLTYALILASALLPPVETTALLPGYLVAVGIAAVGIALPLHLYRHDQAGPRTRLVLLVSAGLAAVLCLAWIANIRPLKADTIYKQGLTFDSAQNWERAAATYELAAKTAPSQDYYLLFAGRARLEQARAASDPARRDELTQIAVERLERARAQSPLNTDHTANLARAYRTWAEDEPDQAIKRQRLETASLYYEQAVALSPQNAQLYNEWGLTYSALGDVDLARARYEQSLALDDRYAMTRLLLGDLYLDAKQWADAIAQYEDAVELTPDSVSAWSRLAYALSQAERWDDAIAANERVLALIPDDYVTLRNLVYIYHTQGDEGTALAYLDRAIAVAPADEVASLRTLREQLAQP